MSSSPHISLPQIPSDLDPKLREYLTSLTKVITSKQIDDYTKAEKDKEEAETKLSQSISEVSAYKSGEVIEIISSPCDGSVIKGISGDYTIENVTGRYVPSTSADVAITGASITYTPPPHATRVEYEFHFLMARGGSGHDRGIAHYTFWFDGSEITEARRSINSYFETLIVFKWSLPAWEGAKTMELRCRAYTTSYDQDLHNTYYWNGGASSQLARPFISVKAIA